jgi:hypothetical protein
MESSWEFNDSEGEDGYYEGERGLRNTLVRRELVEGNDVRI